MNTALKSLAVIAELFRAIVERLKLFFSYQKQSSSYKIAKTIWIIIFASYIIVESVVEFLVLAVLYTLGFIFGKLGLVGAIPAFLFGLLVYFFQRIFFATLFLIGNLLDVIPTDKEYEHNNC